jgi:hypothetical protein
MIQSTIAKAVRNPTVMVEMIRILRLLNLAWSIRTNWSVSFEVNASGVVEAVLLGSEAVLLGSFDESFAREEVEVELRFFFD